MIVGGRWVETQTTKKRPGSRRRGGRRQARKRKPLRAQPPRSAIQARYDAAQTTETNRGHWFSADNLSADAANSRSVRRTIRSRARHEIANNSYARGLIVTLADYVVGDGPLLQLLTDDDDYNGAVEAAYGRWAASIGWAEKLRTMHMARVGDGESFGLLVTRRRPVDACALDVRLLECDRVASPSMLPSPREVDGIRLDESGDPVSYAVLREHPGSNLFLNADKDEYPAERVLHYFRPDRPEQHRGVSELAPSLPLYSLLRRYCLAVLKAAETAAKVELVLKTDAPANEDDTHEPPQAGDPFYLSPEGATFLPNQWDMGGFTPTQPSTTHKEFVGQVLREIGRAQCVPYNIVAGDSSEYNYASGQLDKQMFFLDVSVNQQRLQSMVVDRVFGEWTREASLLPGYLPSRFSLRLRTESPEHQWLWTRPEHVDPEKEARAQHVRLNEAGTSNLAIECGRLGHRWRDVQRQRDKELELSRSGRPGEPGADDGRAETKQIVDAVVREMRVLLERD